MAAKTPRASNLELLRILCMLLIIGDHLTGQGGIADYSSLPSSAYMVPLPSYVSLENSPS